ncbi:UNVERIFIED_CONTAM: hypothetical protein Sradi_3844000 [Sesamum radiatum]|uniref:Uncharacterized protein n=1 Tax=Sesamum radiatum TaxID=300843 RepID=A0AAW2Q1A2_SESRA
MADFWWHCRGEKRMHWVACRKLCQPKAIGGLGFRELKEFNVALLPKQGWRIMTRPASLLSSVLKAEYFPTGTFWNVEVGSCPLLTWQGICGVKLLLEEGCRNEPEKDGGGVLNGSLFCEECI